MLRFPASALFAAPEPFSAASSNDVAQTEDQHVRAAVRRRSVTHVFTVLHFMVRARGLFSVKGADLLTHPSITPWAASTRAWRWLTCLPSARCGGRLFLQVRCSAPMLVGLVVLRMLLLAQSSLSGSTVELQRVLALFRDSAVAALRSGHDDFLAFDARK